VELLKILYFFKKGGLLDFMQIWCSVEDYHGRQRSVALGVVKRGDGRMKGRRLMGSLKLNIGILLNFTLEAKIGSGIGHGEEG
jgi:hypothetical protein